MNNDDYIVCSICYLKISKTNNSILIPCFHTFCYHCIVHWLKYKAICPVCMDLCWLLTYSIRTLDDYQIIPIRPDPMYLECDTVTESMVYQDKVYRPHLFINPNGEYECSIVETNRIRQLLGLTPLDYEDE